MREYIFIGSNNEIDSLISSFNEIITNFLIEFGNLFFKIEDASDAFFIGAFTMAFDSILTFINPSIYYIYPALYFFIFTKLISQYSYSKSYTLLGEKKKFNMY